MISELFIVAEILLGLVLLMFLIGGIKLFKPIEQWFGHQTKLEASFIEGQKTGIEKERTRIGRILKAEYNTVNSEEAKKIIIKINKLMKQEEETL